MTDIERGVCEMTDKPILHNKIYLYLTEFFSGMAVMAVELGASRLLAPYFSSSQIVWTIIIGTIMIAMSLGNVWGGRSADRHPDPDRLYRRLLAAAAWIALIPLVGRYIILGVSGVLLVTLSNNLLIIAAFISCMLIFVFPLFLLGTVTPSLARYTLDHTEESGSVVGRLSAANTIGSIIGTFLPTFVTIPAVGTAWTFLIFSGILLVLALIYFISGRCYRNKKNVIACVISGILYLVGAITATSASSFAFWERNLAYEGESIYNYLQVRDSEEDVILSTNVLFGVQSIMKKDGGLTGMYYDYALAAPIMAGLGPGDAGDVLILGMGTGTYAHQLREFFGERFNITGVEIDEKITRLAHEYFDMPDDIPVETYDGRAYIAGDTGLYDVIMVDAYQDITIPFQMSSVEFFTMVRDHLKPNGVMVVNINMRTDGENGINAYLCDTIAQVFEDEVYTVEVPGTTNRELFTSDNCPMIALEHYVPGNRLFTDDKAPVELLGMSALDTIVSDEAGYYRRLYRDEGLGGLMRALQ